MAQVIEHTHARLTVVGDIDSGYGGKYLTEADMIAQAAARQFID